MTFCLLLVLTAHFVITLMTLQGQGSFALTRTFRFTR